MLPRWFSLILFLVLLLELSKADMRQQEFHARERYDIMAFIRCHRISILAYNTRVFWELLSSTCTIPKVLNRSSAREFQEILIFIQILSWSIICEWSSCHAYSFTEFCDTSEVMIHKLTVTCFAQPTTVRCVVYSVFSHYLHCITHLSPQKSEEYKFHTDTQRNNFTILWVRL